MSTYCAIHLKTTDQDEASGFLREWLVAKGGVEVSTTQAREFPADFYSDKAFHSGSRSPSRFAMTHTPEGWITAHYNSFHQPDDLTRGMSARLSAMTITVMAQSVSEAYFIQVVEAGQILRTIYFAGDSGEWARNEGAPLPFERHPLGTDISDGSEPFYVFGRDDAIAYCADLGLALWEDTAPASWLVISSRP